MFGSEHLGPFRSGTNHRNRTGLFGSEQGRLSPFADAVQTLNGTTFVSSKKMRRNLPLWAGFDALPSSDLLTFL